MSSTVESYEEEGCAELEPVAASVAGEQSRFKVCIGTQDDIRGLIAAYPQLMGRVVLGLRIFPDDT